MGATTAIHVIKGVGKFGREEIKCTEIQTDTKNHTRPTSTPVSEFSLVGWISTYFALKQDHQKAKGIVLLLFLAC